MYSASYEETGIPGILPHFTKKGAALGWIATMQPYWDLESGCTLYAASAHAVSWMGQLRGYRTLVLAARRPFKYWATLRSFWACSVVGACVKPANS